MRTAPDHRVHVERVGAGGQLDAAIHPVDIRRRAVGLHHQALCAVVFAEGRRIRLAGISPQAASDAATVL